MSETSCGKSDRCIYGTDCPCRKRPLTSYLCFERGEIKKKRRDKNDSGRSEKQP